MNYVKLADIVLPELVWIAFLYHIINVDIIDNINFYLPVSSAVISICPWSLECKRLVKVHVHSCMTRLYTGKYILCYNTFSDALIYSLRMSF